MYKNTAQSAEAYRTQQIMTASPAELTLMLYNGAIKFTNEAMKALEEKNYEEKNTLCIKAQNIISEFQVTLKMDYDFCTTWMALYDYIKKCLFEGNVHNDMAKLEEAKNLITEFRNTWHEVMKIDKANKAEAAIKAGTAGIAR
ncbi:MAG: flagellar protein FliS [Firmicutes bacterium]|nr:flagellar protein FliS [Bacillota bacterium]